MITDIFSEIGNTHRICEDYATSRDGIVILSDGCSSSKNTDVGARVLSLVAMHYFTNKYFWDNEEINPEKISFKEIAKEADEIIEGRLCLDQEALDATMLVAIYKNKNLHIITNGDGVIVKGRKNGDILYRGIVFPQNTPFYVNYYNDSSRKDAFDCLEKRKISSYLKGYNQSDFGLICRETREGYYDYFHFDEQDLSDLDYVLISTDGIGSFYRNEKTETSSYSKNIETSEIVKQITSFKNFNKGFIQRKLNAFSDFCKKNDWHHYDDFTVGGFSFKD